MSLNDHIASVRFFPISSCSNEQSEAEVECSGEKSAIARLEICGEEAPSGVRRAIRCCGVLFVAAM
jgi:hypothetical protein